MTDQQRVERAIDPVSITLIGAVALIKLNIDKLWAGSVDTRRTKEQACDSWIEILQYHKLDCELKLCNKEYLEALLQIVVKFWRDDNVHHVGILKAVWENFAGPHLMLSNITEGLPRTVRTVEQ